MKNRTNPLRPGLSAAVLGLFALTAGAGRFDMPWHRFAPGGTASSGGRYRVVASVASLGAGSAGSNTVALRNLDPLATRVYQLASGFTAVVLQPTPSAPALSFAGTGDAGTFSWASSGSGGTLQQSSSLGPDAQWTDVEAAVTTNGTTRSVQIQIPEGRNVIFYRLRQ